MRKEIVAASLSNTPRQKRWIMMTNEHDKKLASVPKSLSKHQIGASDPEHKVITCKGSLGSSASFLKLFFVNRGLRGLL